MSTNRFILFLALFCINASLLSAVTLAVNGNQTDVSVENLDPAAIEVRASIGDIQITSQSAARGDFTRISLPGFQRSLEVGEPELAEIHQLIEIPVNAEARIEIISEYYDEYSLSELGFDAPVFPAQPSLLKSQIPQDVEFHLLDNLYNQDAFLNRDPVSVEIAGMLRGIRIANLIIRPIDYNPVTGILRIHSNLEFVVHFDGADFEQTAALKRDYFSPVFEPVYQMLANHEISNDRDDLVLDPVTYAIVANPIFEGQLDEFINWKTQKGYTVITGYTDEIGSSTSAIKSWLQDLYQDPAEGVSPPSFVLFVGDVAQVPTWNGNTGGHVTDLKYCEYTNDYMPEVYYGRFSASNAGQLQAQLDKTMEYDQYLMPDPAYLGEVVMIAGMDGSFGQVWANGQINYGTSQYFNEDHGIYSNTYLYPNSGSNYNNIINDVSNGVGYVNYTAHGSQTSWADPSFTINNINNLDNAHEYPLVVGNCCLTNAFDYGTCFGEAWLRAEEKGAIGYIGGSNNTYWNEDYWWGVGSGNVVQYPTYEATGPGAYDGIFHDHGEAESEWYVANSAIIMAGNLAVVQGGGNMNYYWEIYHLMGDPSLSTYMGVPAENTVDHLPILQIGLDTFTVTAEEYSYVGLAMDGVLYGAGQVGPSGVLELAIDPILTAGTATIVVSKQNRIPYVGDVEVGNAEGPYLIVDNLLVADDSNGNGEIDYGETVDAIICAENVGAETATGVIAVVTTEDPYITLTQDMVTFDDIQSNEIQFSIEAITMEISNETPDGHTAALFVTFVSNEDTWSGNYYIDVNAYCVLGDVNADWNIDILDVIRAVNIIIHSGLPPTELELCACDTNEDGIVNILDVIGMINFIVG